MRGVAAGLLAVLLFSLPLERVRAQNTGQSGTGAPAAVRRERPQWVRDLHRGEIIAFGAFPFTVFFARTAYESWKWGYYDNFNWNNRRYAPWPVKPAGAERLSNDEFLAVIGAAAGTAVIIAVVDHILIRVRRSREARTAARRPPGEVQVETSPWPPESQEEQSGAAGDTPPDGAGENAP
ncbi:MAG: hypothetical protein LBC88_02860 [Spirochaetaceae bacterium]|jgi:hypothetical protein|nr:hypothetical protein [Spirochaetaceae bacterium]